MKTLIIAATILATSTTAYAFDRDRAWLLIPASAEQLWGGNLICQYVGRTREYREPLRIMRGCPIGYSSNPALGMKLRDRYKKRPR